MSAGPTAMSDFRQTSRRGPRQTDGVVPDRTDCLRIVESRDARFDGWFVTCVRSTHIYCRPSCPAIVVREPNLDFVSSPAAAQQPGGSRLQTVSSPKRHAGLAQMDTHEPTLRPTPSDSSPMARSSPRRHRRARGPARVQPTTCTARVRARRLGAPPVAIAHAQRASTARLLLERTDLPISSVAFAAGFASVRQFNETIKTTYAATPTQLRDRPDSCADGASTITVDLAFRPPFAADAWLDHLALRCIDGVEAVCDGSYVRSLRLPHGPAAVRLRPSTG